MEFKFIVFAAAAVGMIPLGVLAAANRRILRAIAVAIPLPMAAYSSTAVNFFSEEWYRGSSRGMEVSLIYLLAAALLLALAIRGGVKGLFPEAGVRIYLLYFLCSLPSLANAENLLYCWFELWKMMMTWLVWRAYAAYLDFSDGDVDAPLTGFALVAVFNFLVVLKQHVVGCAQATGVFAHQNSMAMWMLLAGAVFFSACFNHRLRNANKLYVAAFLCAAASLARTYSRGAIACFPVAVAVATLVSLRRNFDFGMVSRRLLPMAVAGCLGVAAMLPKIIERFETAPESSLGMRQAFAVAARNMILDKPYAGVGINNWGLKINPPYEYSEHREAFRMPDDYKDGIVETVYLLVWAECGTFCFAALAGWFLFHLFAALRLTKRLAGDGRFWLAAGILGGLTGIYLQSGLEWVLKQQINFVQLMVCFAILAHLRRYAGERERNFAPAKGAAA